MLTKARTAPKQQAGKAKRFIGRLIKRTHYTSFEKETDEQDGVALDNLNTEVATNSNRAKRASKSEDPNKKSKQVQFVDTEFISDHISTKHTAAPCRSAPGVRIDNRSIELLPGDTGYDDVGPDLRTEVPLLGHSWRGEGHTGDVWHGIHTHGGDEQAEHEDSNCKRKTKSKRRINKKAAKKAAVVTWKVCKTSWKYIKTGLVYFVNGPVSAFNVTGMATGVYPKV